MSPLLALPSLFGAALSLGVAVALSRTRPGRVWRYGRALGVTVALWCLGQTVWFLAGGVESRILMSRIQYIGIASTPPLWLMTALAYVGSRRWLTPRFKALYFVIPVLTMIAAFTNDSHHLVWLKFAPVAGQSQAEIVYGKWFLVHTAYSYAMAAGGSLILAARFSASPLYRPQLAVVLLGPGLVLVMNLMYLTSNSAMPIDPTPASFAVSFALFAWAMARHRFFEILPLARGVTIEGLRDAMIVVDGDSRIIDTNPAARDLMGNPPRGALGARLASLMPMLDLATLIDRGTTEVRMPDGRRLEVRASRMIEGDGVSEGGVVLMRDVTAERTAQERLMEAQALLEQANHELERLALTDALTGLANRRRMMAALDEETARARRHGRDLSFLMIDLDHFKRVNDGHGHAVGDQVLARLGAAMPGGVRPGDVAARLGGEEFGILLPEADLTEACEIARRLKSALDSLAHTTPDGSALHVTASVGIATLREGDATPEYLVARADAALYETKARGRDGLTREDGEGFTKVDDGRA